MKKTFIYTIILLLFIPFCAYSSRNITISTGNIYAVPVAINNFAHDDTLNNSEKAKLQKLSKEIVGVIRNDLRSSSLFRVINESDFIEKRAGLFSPDFLSWIKISNILVNGLISYTADKKLSVTFVIWDTATERVIHSQSIAIHEKYWRRTSHIISDTVYKLVTSNDGYFDTKITFVSEIQSGNSIIKRIAMMDFDGHNLEYLTPVGKIVLTPRFSPDTSKIMYLSYLGDVPKLYTYHIDKKKIEPFGKFKGMSFAPRFSPFGDKVVFCIARDGSTNIYQMDLVNKKQTRLTNNPHIDTSPTYSPDGTKVVFQSDRTGARQIYTMDSDGRNVARISFGSGSYATPVWSPDGKYIAFTKKNDQVFQIGIMKSDGSDERIIVKANPGDLVESPTWSPGGNLIMYTKETTHGSKRLSKLYVTDITGNDRHVISTPYGASDPEWSHPL